MIIRRCRRVLPLLAVFSLVVATSTSAQVSGLKKKAARMAAPGAAPAANPGARPNVVVTPDVINHYLAGLKARKAERDRIAKTNTPVGKYFAAQDASRAHEIHCRDFDRKRSENYSRLVTQQKYDSASALAQVRDTTCETGMSQPQEPEFQDLADARGAEDTAAAVGAEMDVTAWASLDEWVPQLMYQMVNSPEKSSAELASNFGRKPSEVEALKARKDEVAAALGIPPRQKPVEQQVATPAPVPTTPTNIPGMPSQGSALCLQTEMDNQKARIEALSAKGDAAQKANDMTTVMAVADSVGKINMAVMKKCGMMESRRGQGGSGAVNRIACLWAVALTCALHGPLVAQASLSVRLNGQWVEWWRSDRAPDHWANADSTLMAALHWRSQGQPIDWGDVELSGPGEAWRLKAIVVRVDPRRVRFSLTTRLADHATIPEWTIDSAASGAILAVNAGQFAGAAPWGWVVHRGVEVRPRGRGPLAVTIVFDSSGAVSFVGDSAAAAIVPGATVVEAFQSYPLLLTSDGEVPAAYHDSNPLLDLEHRDSRLGLGLDRSGHLIVMLTRFNGLGGTLDRVPVGITVPEMAAIMGALGCRTAVALDGGISGQLLLRTADTTAAWRGWRKVPLGLMVMPRE